MNKAQAADSIRDFWGILPKELQDRVPPQCRRCPTLLWFATIALDQEKTTDRTARKVLRRLDRAQSDSTSPLPATVLRYDARDLADHSDLALERRGEAQAALGKLVPLTESYPGSVVGNLTLTNPAEVLLSKVVGAYWGWGPRERSCPNPGFEAVRQDPDVHGALQYGNWIGNSIEE